MLELLGITLKPLFPLAPLNIHSISRGSFLKIASLEVYNLVSLFQSSEICEHRTHLPSG